MHNDDKTKRIMCRMAVPSAGRARVVGILAKIPVWPARRSQTRVELTGVLLSLPQEKPVKKNEKKNG